MATPSKSVAKTLRISKFKLCRIEHGMYVHFDVRHLIMLSDLYHTTTIEILSAIPDGLFDDIDY